MEKAEILQLIIANECQLFYSYHMYKVSLVNYESVESSLQAHNPILKKIK
jgi:hypothetical protein